MGSGGSEVSGKGGLRGEAVWKVVLGGCFATCVPEKRPYPTDLSDAEWNHIAPHLPSPKRFGPPRSYDLREILNAVYYLPKTGCQWRLMSPEGYLVLPHRWVVERKLSPTISKGG